MSGSGQGPVGGASASHTSDSSLRVPSDRAVKLTSARLLFEQGQPAQALALAAEALGEDPNDRQTLDVIDDMTGAVLDPLLLLPHEVDERTWPAVAVRARVHMTRREFTPALELLCAVVRLRPTVNYLDWPRRWLVPHVVATLPAVLLQRTVVDAALFVASHAPTPLPPEHALLPNLHAAVAYLAAIRQVHTNDWTVWHAEAQLRRLLGDLDGALATARHAVALAPSFATQLELGECLSAAGHRPEAAAVLAPAVALVAPSDSAAFRLGSLLLDCDRPLEALTVLEPLLARVPGHTAAKASVHYARARAHGSESDRNTLLQLRERSTAGTRIADLANLLDPPIPCWNVLPGPGDCTAAAVRALVREIVALPAGSSLQARVGVTYLESPSVHVAFKLVSRVTSRSATLEVIPELSVTPDPRQPRAQVEYQLFRYEGDTPVLVYPSADPRAQKVVAQVAADRFAKERWDALAAPLAAQLGPQWVHGILAVMTDPPAPEAGFGPIQWVQRVQVAAAVVLSHLDGGWAESQRRRALYSLALGPSDWSVGAGLIALGWRAADDPRIRADVEPLFEWLATQIPTEGYTAWEATLAQVWLALGGHSAERHRWLVDWTARAAASASSRNRAKLLDTNRGGSVRPGPPVGSTMV